MGRGVVDLENMEREDIAALRDAEPPKGLPFRATKLGHVVLRVQDLERSVDFYTRILGFQVSDVYPESMVPGRMVFLRCNPDHHCLALVGGAKGPNRFAELHHLAFEVSSLDELYRARKHLREQGVKIDFDGRRRAGCQIAVEFRDPDDHRLELYWGLDQVCTGGEVRPPEDWRECFSLEEATDSPPPGQDTTLRDPTLRED
jgi:catechol 2,3-dioxygenase-like lactoylglutathione lyase family enzyme